MKKIVPKGSADVELDAQDTLFKASDTMNKGTGIIPAVKQMLAPQLWPPK